jgi:plasmid stabilization system protein ParE
MSKSCAHCVRKSTRASVRPGLRSFAATPHVVFYRVVDETPQIVRLLDGRQNIEQKFAVRDGE